MIITELNTITQSQLLDWGIQKIIFDSNEACTGALFCALVGIHTDGHRFIEQAKQKGVRHFLVSNGSFIEDNDDLIYMLCDNTRLAMADLASIYYGAPSRKMKIVGVTGTDGKSTTSQLIMQLIEAMGERCGLISTVNIKTGSTIEANNLRQSTPEAPQIEEALAHMLDAGIQYAVLEATSHGLAQATGRLAQIHFAAGVFTNVTIEHLEFHQTVERYRDDKANLFRKVAQVDGFAVINGLSEHVDLYVEASAPANTYLYGSANSDLWVEEIESSEDGFHFLLKSSSESKRVHLPMVGRFNIENALAAVLCVAKLFNVSALTVAEHLSVLKAPAGRMVLVQHAPFKVIIDYAHTPGAFERLLPHMKETTKGKVVVLFGSGGERNLEKRPIQGRLADLHSDVIILTNEDPRLEDEFVILQDIASGVEQKEMNKSLFLIPDRKKAIEHAVSLCAHGDTLLLLGKGHEGSIIGPQGKMPWSEEQVAIDILRDKGFLA